MVRYPGCRSVVYHPSWFVPGQTHVDVCPPPSELQLEYVHGYSGETGKQDRLSWSTNVVWLRTGELAFPASSLVVIHDFEHNQQRFFKGHDEDVMAVTVHPYRDIVASGQAGKEATVCIFDASPQAVTGSSHGDKSRHPLTKEEPRFISELLTSKESKGVASLEFSPDGRLLLSMAADNGHALSIWDWVHKSCIAVHKAHSVSRGTHSIRFNTHLFVAGQSAQIVGFGPGAAQYTLVSCGKKCVKFWTLARSTTPPAEAGGRGVRGGERGTGIALGGRGTGAGLWGGSGPSRVAGAPDTIGQGSCAWTLEGKPGNFGRRGEVQDMMCLAFVGQSPGMRGQGLEMGTLPLARTVTGGENGQVFFWETLEDEEGMGWRPCGKLLSVIPAMHEGPITDMSFLTAEAPPTDSLPGGGDRVRPGSEAGPGGRKGELGLLATCGGEGTLRLWQVTAEGPLPLKRLLSVEVSSRGAGVGHPRSVSWDRSGTTLALGTVGNAVCLVQPGEVSSSLSVGQRGGGATVMFMLALQGHTGVSRAVAAHPHRAWFVTGGSDRTLRLWDRRSRRQLSAARLLERITSTSFHPSGDILCVGTAAGDYLLMSLQKAGAGAPHGEGSSSGSAGRGGAGEGGRGWGTTFSWEVLARKRVIHAAVAAAPTLTSRGATSTVREGRRHGRQRGRRGGGERSEGQPGGSEGGGAGQGGVATARGRSSSRGSISPVPGGEGGGGSGSVSGRGGGLAEDSVSASPVRDASNKRTADVTVVAFSPDGETLAAACGRAVYLWCRAGRGEGDGQPREGQERREGRDPGGPCSGAGFRRYATCQGHSTMVKAVDFSRDGTVLQTNDSSGEVLFWDVKSGKQV
ncbi:unnamed protein product, partial [Discosporangium mesarthrocarpum]